MARKDKRFELIEEQSGFIDSYEVIRDKETGVCYLVAKIGYAAGITPLLGTDGRPVVDRASVPLR